MRIFRQIADIPQDFGPTLVSVGNFDGVHRAHTRVLTTIAERARRQGVKSVAVCFEPHPSRILRPGTGPKLLTPTPEKLRLLSPLGIDAVLLLPFTRDLSLLSPREFAEDILKKGLQAREVHEGYNFHFGHKAAGSVATLIELGKLLGFEVAEYPEMRLRGEPVSSSHIRSLLSQGRVNRARHLLARPFSITSEPVQGRGLGSKYTVPTINLARYDEMVPRDGVYITRTRIRADGNLTRGECFNSVTNVGHRPTFGGDSFAIETHLLNFHPIDLGPETEVEVEFLNRLRDEIKFPSVEALRRQISSDVKKAERYFRLGALCAPRFEMSDG
ncbi:MAG: bifunctional riboflavin kinase/FAD synthetase [Acidobacteriales bacterium]|nr:bifunctional riboflavin kinase/FAD synthetase [Terriglobales bacterium]